MSEIAGPVITVRVDPTNPGQFFACCGLLELADRLWGGAEGWFDQSGIRFVLRPTRMITDLAAGRVIEAIGACALRNTMTESQLKRREGLSEMPKKTREAEFLEDEKKSLDSLWRDAPILLLEPFNLRVDWFLDDRAGGSDFKTWAGQQSVLEIASDTKAAVGSDEWKEIAPQEWFSWNSHGSSCTFNFDSDLGGLGSDRDIGFSLDPLKMNVRTRPLVEFAAFVGLQRFRPRRVVNENRYQFSLWAEPMVPEVAFAAASGVVQSRASRMFEFRLLYRTKYLKSFLPADPK